jgi:hypothetical protein
MTIKRAGMACGIALLLGCAVFGQRKDSNDDTATRSLQGVVSAANHPVAKAVVQLKDMKSLQIRSFITDSDGSYHFAGLSSNVEYEVKAEHDGAFSSKKTLDVFNTQKTVTIHLKLNK